MRRDLNLIREILLRLEELPMAPNPTPRAVEIKGYDGDQIHAHIELLRQAGYVQPKGPQHPIAWYGADLTSKGHDFLAAARSREIWRRALTRCDEYGIDPPLPVLEELLVSLVRLALFPETE